MKVLLHLVTLAIGASFGAGGMWVWANQPATYVGIGTVTDGDTIRLGERNIRVVGIDAPELPAEPKKCRRYLERPECTNASSAALHELIDGKLVSCTEAGRDQLGRTLAICWLGNIELNVWLIELCLAGSPRRARHRDARYEKLIAARNCTENS